MNFAKKSEIFSTAENGQSSVDVHVLQGERDFAADNRTLGNFKLDGIPPAPRGVPQIEVTFDIDADGILNVSARDKATGKEQKITITSSSGLSDTDIDRMVKEAEQNEEADSNRRKVVEARNNLDSLTYQAAALLSENEDKLGDSAKSGLSTAIENARAVLESGSIDELSAASSSLASALQETAKEMYADSQQQDESDVTSPDDVVDAEVMD